MKKLLLLICVCTFVSCSQDEEFLQVEKETAALENENLMTAEMRTITFMDPSNLVPLYEYSYGSEDYYYATQFLGATFYDSNSGRTYSYSCQLGKINRDLYPYYGILSPIDKLALFYNSKTGKHRVINSTYPFDGWGNGYSSDFVKVRDLGYILCQISFEDRDAHQATGEWDFLYANKNTPDGDIWRLKIGSSRPNGWVYARSVGWTVVK